jgi:Xaa-Pro aminopeptidase
MAEHDAMLFFGGESVRKSADEDFPFFPNRNFLYLTGLKQERSALLLQKRGDLTSECLFVASPDPEQEAWTGRRFTHEEINTMSGVEGVEDINNLIRTLDELLFSQQAMTLWLCFDALAPERLTADGCENLSVAIPASIEEIESLMAQKHDMPK